MSCNVYRPQTHTIQCQPAPKISHPMPFNVHRHSRYHTPCHSMSTGSQGVTPHAIPCQQAHKRSHPMAFKRLPAPRISHPMPFNVNRPPRNHTPCRSMSTGSQGVTPHATQRLPASKIAHAMPFNVNRPQRYHTPCRSMSTGPQDITPIQPPEP